MEQQDGEDNHHRDGQTAIYLWLGFLVFLPLTSNSHGHSLWKFNLIHLVYHLIRYVVEVQTAFGVGHNRHRTNAVAMVNGGVCPVGRHLSHLS